MTDTDATVYIVDDDPGARASVKALVESHGVRSHDFPSAEAFLECIVGIADRRGCIVADVRMKGMSGLELQRRVKQEAIGLPVIMITAYADVPMAVRAVQDGAVDFLTKPCEPDRLWSTIAHALDFDREQRARERNRKSVRQRLGTLTADERAVLDKVMDGLQNKRIARDLDIGLRTVELRRANIMKKMNADSLAELIQLALLAGVRADSRESLGRSDA